MVLIEHQNQIITKDDLISEIWNGRAVSDDSLTQQISRLRKILDDKLQNHQFIVTIPGTGYKFVAHVYEVDSRIRQNQNSVEKKQK